MRKNLFRTARFLAVFGLMAAFSSCGSGGGSTTDGGSDSTMNQQEKEKTIKDAKKVVEMISLPSPVETADLLKRAGAKYNEALLNPTSNKAKYISDKQMALNLGVYGADLSYASIFQQDQAVMDYMTTSKKLAIGLDLLSAIDESITDRLDANKDNKDSVIRIISETFMNSNSSLKDDERPKLAALILAGGWIEGLYLGTSLVETIDQKDLVNRIVEQKLSFGELQKLLDKYNDQPMVTEVIDAIAPLKTAFDAISIKTGAVTAVVDSVNNTVTMKSEQKIEITQEQYDGLKAAVAQLRNSIIQ